MPFVITNPEEDQPEEEQLSMPSQQQSNLPEQDGQFVITEEEQEEIPQQQGFEFQTAGDIAQNITRPGNIGIKDFIGGFLQTATGLSTSNYDATLIGWEATLQAAYPSGVGYPHSITITFGGSQYTGGGAADAARASLISTFGWTITDGGSV